MSHRPTRRGLAAVAAVVAVLVAACGTKEEPAAGALEPLPAPPVLEVDPEALPGADGKLAVVVARPVGETDEALAPTITFSKPMVALEAATAVPAAPATIEPAIPGAWRWLGSTVVEFVPAEPLPFATSFRVTVPAGLAALDGSRLEEPYVWEYATPRPHLQVTRPDVGWRWLTERPEFRLQFDQPVEELERHVRIRAGGATFGVRIVRTDPLGRERAPGAGEDAPSRIRAIRYDVAPTSDLPADSEVVLEVDGALKGADGPLTLGETATFAFRTRGPMRLTEARACGHWGWDARCPYGPVLILATNPTHAAALKGRIRIEPEVELDWDAAGEATPSGDDGIPAPYVALPGNFRPGTTYRIRVEAGVTDLFRQAAPAAEFTVRTDDLEPLLDPGPGLALLEASGDGALPLGTVNLDTVVAEVWPLSSSELARLLEKPWCQGGPCRPAGTPRTVRLPVGGTKNVPRTIPLELKPLLEGRSLFHVQLRSPALDRPEHRPRFAVTGQLTDLAVHTKLGAVSGVAWVTRLSTGAPVAGAQVALHDREGRVRWEGVTDADGIARIPGLATLLPEDERRHGIPPALVTAAHGDDLGATLSSWQGEFHAGAFGIPADWDGTRPHALGTVFAERGIYRPGDEVHLKGIFRRRRLGEIGRPPAGEKVTVRVHSSRDQEVAAIEVPLTAFGSFATRVTIPADAPLGVFRVAATLGAEEERLHAGGSFRVEEYRAPRFRVDVDAPATHAFAGDDLRATVTARYLHGGAMAGADARWSVMRESVFFEPPGHETFTFGPQVWWWDDEEPVGVRDVFAAGRAVLGTDGAASVAPGKAETEGGRTFAYVTEVEVADVDRQRVANRAIVTVHPAAFYAGVRVKGDGFARAGRPVRVEAIAVAPDGAVREGERLELRILRREWTSIRKLGAGGSWYVESEPVETPIGRCELRSDAAPVACEFTPEKPGLHVIVATATDREGRRQETRSSFYVVGDGWVSWQRSDSERLDLVADRRLYEPGETAKILVKSPYPEAEALVTVEREGVRSVRRIRLAGAAQTIDVPLDEAAIPNVFVSVVLVRGRVEAGQGIESGADPGRPAVRVGYAELRVEKRGKRLAVQVTPDRAERRPREKLRVDVKVTGADGKPRRAEVTLWAVDEGVLRLTGYEPPDPVELFHPRRGLSVRTGEPLQFLVEKRRFGDKGRSAGGSGGGDASGAGFRSQFRTTLVFAPELVTDATGRASVEVELPDNLTTFRLLALALTEGDEAGTGVSAITVTKPLLALPALPRLARAGDAFEAGVVVHAKGLSGEGTVTAAAEGLILEGPKERKVSLEGGAREVRFRFRAERPGTAILRFAVQGGGERDGVEARLPVVLPLALEAVATYGETRDRRVEAVLPPGGVRPDVGGLELTLSSTALSGFDEGMRQLVEYPYGCLEQMSSRLVPFVSLRELSGRFGVAWNGADGKGLVEAMVGAEAIARFGTTDPDEVVRQTVAKIEALQAYDGGYRYWASDRCASPYASAYAILALGRALQVGYPVDRDAFARGQEFLADRVLTGEHGCGGERIDDVTRTFALWVLARTGAPRPSYLGDLVAKREKLPLFARAMLTDAAFVGGGDRADARRLLGELLAHARETAGEVHFEEGDPREHARFWSSDGRTTAIVLLTLATVSPEHPYVGKIARWLSTARRQDGTWRNTQEAAWTLMALTEVTRVRERETPDFVARVALGDRVVAEQRFAGRSLSAQQVTVPIARLSGELRELAFTKSGDGLLHYGALLRYAPVEVPTTALDRGLVVQRWFEPYAGGGQARSFRAGDLVRVRFRVASPAERRFVAVEVPLPAGLEAVDTTLASTASLPHDEEDEGPEDGYEHEDGEEWGDEEPRFWSPFHHVEKRDDRVALFADRLPPGVHAGSFVARATTPGDFVLLPARAEEMYTPETFGRSDGGRLLVLDAAPVAAR